MFAPLRHDHDRLPALLRAVSDYASEVLARADSASVTARPAAIDLPGLAAAGGGAAVAFARFRETVAPHLTASAGPRYLGFVTGGATPAAVVGDWLTTVFDQNPVSRLDGWAALQLEAHTVAMLRDLFGLPDAYAGTFVTGATMSNAVGLAVAREWAGRQQGVHISEDGVSAASAITVLAGTPHSTSLKALSLLGLGRRAWRPVPCLAGREAVDVEALARALATIDGPAIVIASAGTVNTGDVDDLAALAALKQRVGFYLHVDAAFGAFASVSPDLSSLLGGWTSADSICVDLHKWLNVPYDAAVAFTRHRDLQVDVFANVAAYLPQNRDDPEPIHRAPESSHRWRALPAWFSLTAYGADGYREIVERGCRLARALGDRLQRSDRFTLLAPVRLNIVCFALRQPAATARFVEAVRDRGDVFVTATSLWGTSAVRAAFSSWRTADHDLDVVWQALLAAAAETDSVWSQL